MPEADKQFQLVNQFAIVTPVRLILQGLICGSIIVVRETLAIQPRESARFPRRFSRNKGRLTIFLTLVWVTTRLTSGEKKIMDLNVVVVGMGQWALEQYAPALKNFLDSQFLLLNDVVLNIWFIDPDPHGAARLSNEQVVVKSQQIANVFDFQLPPGLWKSDISGRYQQHTIYIMQVKGSIATWASPKRPDVVFIVNPPQHHIPTAADLLFRYDPVYIVTEKPFCITKAYQQGRSGSNTRPSKEQWDSWRGKVFAFDHYFTRLFCLMYYHSWKLGKIERLIFRMRELHAGAWPVPGNSRHEVGAIQDMAVHAVPLLLLFGEPPKKYEYRCRFPKPQGQATRYFQFKQPNWRPRGFLEHLFQETFMVDIGVGWYMAPRFQTRQHPRVPDKFFCVQCQKGRIWADLAQPFLVFTELKPHNPKHYPKLSSTVQTWGFAVRNSVQLMVNAVCMQTIAQSGVSASSAHPPISILPVSGGTDITAKKIMNVLDAWDEEYRK